MKYYELTKDMSSTFNLRLEMVTYAREHSITACAREFKTTRKTVRKWRDRYEREHTKGLLDQSRAPHHIPHRMPEAKEEKIVPVPLNALKTDMKSLTSDLEKNGELPIVLNPDESGRDNPFSGY